MMRLLISVMTFLTVKSIIVHSSLRRMMISMSLSVTDSCLTNGCSSYIPHFSTIVARWASSSQRNGRSTTCDAALRKSTSQMWTVSRCAVKSDSSSAFLFAKCDPAPKPARSDIDYLALLNNLPIESVSCVLRQISRSGDQLKYSGLRTTKTKLKFIWQHCLLVCYWTIRNWQPHLLW